GFLYNYFYNLLSGNSGTKELEQTVIIMKDDNIIYNGDDFPMIRIKEMLMDISIGNNYYEHKGNKYKINFENFIKDDSNYKIISLNEIIDNSYYYRSLSTIVFVVFLIT